MEVKCRLCGNPTNDNEGICTICRMFRKDEVAALFVIPATSGVRVGFKPTPTKDSGGQTGMTNKIKTGGVEMKEKDYAVHRKCSTPGCKKYRVKEGMCTRCFNKAHGIEKHYVRKSKNVTTPTPPKIGGESAKKRGRPSKAVIPVVENKNVIPAVSKRESNRKGNGDCDGIRLILITAKIGLQQKLLEIENALEVIREYAG